VAVTRRPATYADLEALPEHVTGEIIDGTLYAWPRPRPRHSLAAIRLGSDLDLPFGRGRGGPGGWWILSEPELRLDRQVVVPDLAGWRRERMSEPPATVGIHVAPDWICEILSPTTARLDRKRKKQIYAEHGVLHLWLVDPALRTLEVYRLTQGRWLEIATFIDDDVARVEPFDAVELSLVDWWVAEPPSAASESGFVYGAQP
jgi:Uma2 family endonuclease